MSTPKPDDMAEAFARLKRAEADEIRLHFEPGRDTGDKWAREKSLPSQLKRLARRVSTGGKANEIGTVEDYISHTGEYGSVAECLCWDLIDPTDEDLDTDKFWEEAIGKKAAKAIQHDGYAGGFIVGALWVWEEFKASGQS